MTIASLASPTDVDLLIIGAGWSGMGAADHLIRSNFTNFLVLEATNRTGGRTEAFEFGDPSVGRFTVERGSNWICGTPNAGGPDHKINPIYQEALNVKAKGNFSITLIPGGTQNMSNYWRVYNSNGDRGDSDGSIRNAAFLAQDCINKTAARVKTDMTLRDALTQCGWVPKTEAEKAVDWGFTADEQGFTAEYQSLHGMLPVTAYQWWGLDDYFVLDQHPRGYARLLDTLTTDTIPLDDPRLVFNTIVTKIDYTTTPIIVTSANGRVFRAKHVISTLPLGVMQRNHSTLFVPPLPQKQVDALTTEGAIMSNLTKIFVQFRKPFWDPEVPRFLAADPDLGAFAEWHNMNHPLHLPGSNTMFIWLGEPQSTYWESRTDDEVKAKVMKKMGQLYPGKDLGEMTDFHMTRHSLDPFTYGAYSTFIWGWTSQDFKEMIEPLRSGNDILVYFGGEHTCNDLWGTHGSLIKGREQAAEYLKQNHHGPEYVHQCDW